MSRCLASDVYEKGCNWLLCSLRRQLVGTLVHAVPGVCADVLDLHIRPVRAQLHKKLIKLQRGIDKSGTITCVCRLSSIILVVIDLKWEIFPCASRG